MFGTLLALLVGPHVVIEIGAYIVKATRAAGSQSLPRWSRFLVSADLYFSLKKDKPVPKLMVVLWATAARTGCICVPIKNPAGRSGTPAHDMIVTRCQASI